MERIAFIIYMAVLVLAVLFFGAVHTYAYTVVFLGILIATALVLMSSIDRDPGNAKLRIRLLKTGLNPLFLLLCIYLIFQTIPLPENIVRFISPGAVVVGQKSLPATEALVAASPAYQWFSLASYAYPVQQSMLRWIAYGLFFWGLAQTLNSQKRIELAIFIILVTGCFEALYGMIQSFSGSGHIWWFKKNSYIKIVSGTFINRNHFAGLMGMSLLLMAGFAAALATRGNKRPVTFGGKATFKERFTETLLGRPQLFKRIFIVFSGSVIGMGLVFSASRGGMIAVAAGMLVMGLLFLVRKKHRRKGFVVVLLFVIICVYALKIGADYPLERFKTFNTAFDARKRYVQKTLEMFDDYRTAGVGVGNFKYVYPKYQAAADKNFHIEYANNDWIQFMSEAGVVGFGLLLIGMFYYIYLTVKIWSKRNDSFAVCVGMVPLVVMVSMAVHSSCDFNFHIPANFMIFAAILAIGFSALHLRGHHRNKVHYQYQILYLNPKGVLSLLLFAGLVIWAGVWTMRHFVAEAYCNTVRNSTLNRDQNPALKDIKAAIAWDGRNAGYWYKLALGLSKKRDQGLRIQDAKLKEQELRKIQMEIVKTLEKAVRLNPFAVEYHQQLGWEYARMWLEPDFGSKWFPAADISMERTAYFAGEKSPLLHVKLGHYWVMRSKVMAPVFAKWKPAWTKAGWHYQKALELESDNKRLRKGMIQQIKRHVRMYYPDEGFVKNALGTMGSAN
ncbi:MAG: O-antigen ligase family protein [Desulfobacteraceae bacterium]|nr:O-antigen ligase family protein [Desulfobacteraceae bacterium]